MPRCGSKNLTRGVRQAVSRAPSVAAISLAGRPSQSPWPISTNRSSGCVVTPSPVMAAPIAPAVSAARESGECTIRRGRPSGTGSAGGS